MTNEQKDKALDLLVKLYIKNKGVEIVTKK